MTATILSMSLLTVMAGAAIAPALGIIKAHFSEASAMTVQLIVSMPALLIIVTSLLFLPISRVLRTRTIATTGLLLYVIAGAGCFFMNDIYLLLTMRALLGVSVGLIATLLAGLLATIEWNYAFLVYLLGMIALVMVWIWLPDEQLGSANKRGVPFQPRQLLKFHPSVIGMLLLMTIFFIFPTNFAILASQRQGLSTEVITGIMVGLDVVAFFVGLKFGSLMNRFRQSVKYFAPLLFLLGYGSYLVPTVIMAVLGSAFIGMATGVGVPYLNTIASIKGGKNSATTVMPLLSAALYLGQFISPLIVTPLSKVIFGSTDIVAPYEVGIVLCVIFLLQVYSTRHFQSLPPTVK